MKILNYWRKMANKNKGKILLSIFLNSEDETRLNEIANKIPTEEELKEAGDIVITGLKNKNIRR